MRQNGSIELFHYWNRLRKSRPAPARREIEPVEIKTLLSDTFILEQDARSEAVFRLAGTRICAIFGRELKGFSFGSLWSSRDVSMISRLLCDVFDNNMVVSVNFLGESKGHREIEFEVLLLPLAGDDGDRRVLGTMQPESRPFWLEVDSIEACTISSVRIVDPDQEPVRLKKRTAVPVPPLFSAGTQKDRRRGPRKSKHLTVFDGGKQS